LCKESVKAGALGGTFTEFPERNGSENNLSAEEEATDAILLSTGVVAEEIIRHELQVVALDVVVQTEGPHVEEINGIRWNWSLSCR